MASSVLINIDVNDLDSAVEFYSQAFGLRIGRRLGDSVVELLGLNSPLYLLLTEPGSKPFVNAQQVRDFSRHWSPVHLDFIVENIDTAVLSAVKAGASLENKVQEAPFGKIAMFSDPFGNGFCIIEFAGRGYDEIATNV